MEGDLPPSKRSPPSDIEESDKRDPQRPKGDSENNSEYSGRGETDSEDSDIDDSESLGGEEDDFDVEAYQRWVLAEGKGDPDQQLLEGEEELKEDVELQGGKEGIQIHSTKGQNEYLDKKGDEGGEVKEQEEEEENSCSGGEYNVLQNNSNQKPLHLQEGVEKIYFYDASDDSLKAQDIYLNNFDPSPMTIDKKFFSTVEHYYQASKFAYDEKHFEAIRTSESPLEAKQLARKLSKKLWNAEQKIKWNEEIKVPIMEKAIQNKFDQNKDLKEKLMKTGDKVLIENSPRDAFWGGKLPNSKSMLGIVLMKYRDAERKKLENSQQIVEFS